MALRSRLLWLFLTLGAVIMMLPFWVMIVTSFQSLQEVFAYPPHLLPEQWRIENYGRLFAQIPMATYFWNSLFVAAITTVGHVLICAMAGYAFSRLKFPGKNAIFLVFLITLMVPPQVNIVPLFFVMKLFGWLDSYWALIVPGLFGAFGVFLMRQWFNGLPKELEDAAVLDGCHIGHQFWHIALPLARPAIAALAIFVFVNTWNSFMWPLIVTNSPELMTLPVGIATLKSSYRDVTDWTILMAASTISIFPVMIVFVMGQKQFIAGLMAGGSKE